MRTGTTATYVPSSGTAIRWHKTNACTSEYADQTSSVTALTCAEQQCKHNWVTFAAGIADSDILLIQHHQLLMKYAAQPSSSIIASSADTTDKPCD